MKKFSDLTVSNKRVLLREDLNVPMQDGKISNDARLRASVPTIQMALEKGAAVIILSHLGRPVEGEFDETYSLAPVAERLSTLLGKPVRFEPHWLAGVKVEPGEVVLCDNVRFNVGEKSNDAALAKRLAALADVFVMDAFATAHRAQASTEGVAHYIETACAGPLLERELQALEQAFMQPKRPVAAIVAGSKVSTKLTVLESLSLRVETLIVGGGIANTFLAAAGYPVGKSLCEPDLIPIAKRLLASDVQLPLPEDVVVATEFSADAKAIVKSVAEVGAQEMILDIGPKTRETFRAILLEAATIIWNGPVGVFEFPAFSAGTQALSLAIADSPAFSIAGGGDTIAAIDQFGIRDKLSYISTGGGAFLEVLEGKSLPAVAVLQGR